MLDPIIPLTPLMSARTPVASQLTLAG
jgi:hypothetical protein